MGESKQGAGDCMIDLQREIKGVKITDLYIREAKKKRQNATSFTPIQVFFVS